MLSESQEHRKWKRSSKLIKSDVINNNNASNKRIFLIAFIQEEVSGKRCPDCSINYRFLPWHREAGEWSSEEPKYSYISSTPSFLGRQQTETGESEQEQEEA